MTKSLIFCYGTWISPLINRQYGAVFTLTTPELVLKKLDVLEMSSQSVIAALDDSIIRSGVEDNSPRS
ncbi:hypothetical protein FNN36_21710 [Salmonella enterica]|uniref:Uncharacterized protein n=5 Tax=Salmonella enterica TaxID=28901 RepID=A0A627LV80_SALNE|nr:hypothetical protein [Salmonella enterica]ECG1400992.1 hypothetical protein [Salmonella enterica subsp. enterica serovar Panama str. CFSAN000601]EDE1737654.1 hypothetical protein [Salmonella enterica subsp. enterica serovar Montevideo]EDE1889119.1 hypothetical protein [Salmonella enterica subsp. enterica serovar Enteritidis]EDF3737302.1 hypothetical protein [Salmonella enterica subsp. enterica serovar Typhimurium]EDQ4344517.1 hypothetical protein [Salmonella enterica subsp. enterica serovar